MNQVRSDLNQDKNVAGYETSSIKDTVPSNDKNRIDELIKSKVAKMYHCNNVHGKVAAIAFDEDNLLPSSYLKIIRRSENGNYNCMRHMVL